MKQIISVGIRKLRFNDSRISNTPTLTKKKNLNRRLSTRVHDGDVQVHDFIPSYTEGLGNKDDSSHMQF